MIIQHLANLPSSCPADSSSLESCISALKSSISALESCIKATEGSSGHWETFGWLCAIAVGIGIAGELVVIISEHLEAREDWRRGIIRPPDMPRSWRFWVDIAATIVVLGGVLGEAGASAKIASINSQLRSKTSELRAKSVLLLAVTTEVAGDAATSATTAREEADAIAKQADAQGPRAKLLMRVASDLARKLASFAGQRVGLFVCGQQGLAHQETLDAWGVIANILDSDTVSGVTGAKWKEVPTNLNWARNCGAASGLGQGIIVFVSKHASRRTMEAANILGQGLAKALPPSPNKMPSLIDPDFAKLTVDRGFQDKNAPWVSVGLDPDFITVLIGEHP